MVQKDDSHSAPLCQICGKAMMLVQIDPRIASFAELHTFRCFARSDVRATERKNTQVVQPAAWPRRVGWFQ